MPDVLDIILIGWKKITGFALLTTAVVALITWLLPSKYLSTATALPASSVAADKARVFNTNIEALYPPIGVSDELDKIVGTAMLDTIYISTSKKLNLCDYYGIHSPNEGIYQAAIRLKKQSKVIKSAYGELKVQVWDQDKNKAALFANSLLEDLQQIHQSLQNESNALVLKKIQQDYDNKQQQYQQLSDYMPKANAAMQELLTARKEAQLQQLQEYEKLISEYGLMVSTAPQTLLVVERARPSLKYDKPERLQIILLTFFASLFFSFLTLLFIENRKQHAGVNHP